MKAELKTDERDGCVATVTGCGVGGHTATFRFLNPEYAVDPIKFDGDSVSYARDVLHGDVIVTIQDDASIELRASLEAYSPDTDDEPRKAAGATRKAARARSEATGEHDPSLTVPRGAVTADEKEVVQEGDVAGDSQYEAAGEPDGEALAEPQPNEPDDKGGLGAPDDKPNS